ncbi:type 1 glutamine amidotransferase [Aspergillus clavatus NRRL 1]|uniref:Class I glutamine amidotransferase-like protein n=1 Tax=Aspergillus clavatus (strain ATCC 1007 / CBS 513.65 / DSM 816 / NCTC 3887 / NRRL 1 / QM 1276 / 107) TaxID=344612 RepID=A1CLK6_ASPCL|nr:uncharacterized protein ACLA_042530 [Aspergillus clavatus NRRL 1]EAW10030.1 conserved hypothetical protein [Aspergillus clavatus NRRL 1]
MHIHIAILDLDIPVSTVYAARGLYSSQFTNLLGAAAARLSQTLGKGREITISTSSYDVVGGIFPPLHLLRPSPPLARNRESPGERRSIDAILLTGSSASVYRPDQYPWISPLLSFVTDVYTNCSHIKLFGSCFGHQVLAQALVPRCVVEACPAGYEVGVGAVALSREFMARFRAPLLASLMSEAEVEEKRVMRLQLIHGDWVVAERELPDDWINVGSTTRCPVQGLYRPGRVLTFQGHFEFDPTVNRETCLKFGRRWGWDGELVEGYLREIEVKHGEDDSEVAAEMVVLFFAGEDMRVGHAGGEIVDKAMKMKVKGC